MPRVPAVFSLFTRVWSPEHRRHACIWPTPRTAGSPSCLARGVREAQPSTGRRCRGGGPAARSAFPLGTLIAFLGSLPFFAFLGGLVALLLAIFLELAGQAALSLDGFFFLRSGLDTPDMRVDGPGRPVRANYDPV